MIKSTALEAQAAYSVDVVIDSKYFVLQDVMSKYYGIMDGLNTFLKELSHPHKNWNFIVKDARGYSLDYFHLLKAHPKGGDAAAVFAEVFVNAIEAEKSPMDVKADAADNLLLFLQKIIKDAGGASLSDAEAGIEKFFPVIEDSFHRITSFDDEHFFLFVKSYYQIRKLAQALIEKLDNFHPSSFNFQSLNSLLFKYYKYSYTYWMNEEDPQAWFGRETSEMGERKIPDEFFRGISHEEIHKWNAILLEVRSEKWEVGSGNDLDMPRRLSELPGYNQIVEIYREIPQKLLDAGQENGRGKAWKIIFLLHIMNIPGLSAIHEEALREINRTLTWLISHERHLNIERIIHKTFSIVKAKIAEFPATALNCVLNMGKGVYETDDSELINFFIDSVIELGFQAPMIDGVGDDWQIRVNSAHLQNIRTWLQLIELNPKWSTRLLSYLIIHLSLCGVFIKDTDLFPRDITRFLNSPVEPVYNLVKQLAKLFPTYFNDIGAEGELRDISTRIDEIAHRKDILIHFLRKQVHVESSNRTISFMEAIFHFWETREKDILRPFVPPNIYDQIDTHGPYVDEVHKIMSHLMKKGLNLREDFLTIRKEDLECLVRNGSCGLMSEAPSQTGNQQISMEKVKIAASLYRLLRQKYDLSTYSEIGIELDHYLFLLRSEAFPGLDRLRDTLVEVARPEFSVKIKIFKLLNYLKTLKKIILSSESYEVREDIYKKRHFTVDIPSMYGSYHEMKFDALGLTFRLECIVNVLFDELVESIDLSLITKATFHEIFARLRLFNQALKLDGISTVEIERQLDFLAHSIEVRGFSFTQYLDIFKGLARAVKNIINDYFNNIHEENLNRILFHIPVEQILPKYTKQLSHDCYQSSDVSRNGQPGTSGYQHRIAEIFSRERIAHSLGLQQLDVFLTRILSTLFHQAEKLHKDHLQQLLIYDPQNALWSIHHEADNTGIIYLGNKGFNLIRLKNYGLPVPPGFIITTEVFRFKEMIEGYPPAVQNFREQIWDHIATLEEATGKVFGDCINPMLLSVRSGASISQPGMMDTFLNVGINEDITAGLASRTGNAWFAWDNYRRFMQCYGMSYGLERDDFDAIIGDFKIKKGILYKREFTGEEMRKVALAYKKMISDAGIRIIEDPFKQLLMTIKRVFNSWESPKARTYRKIMGISDDWGTAVTVQSMVFGNFSNYSGTGVFFTHNPRWSGETLRLWGDFTTGDQGEDVVAGLVKTLPISIRQQEIERRNTDTTLETHFPEIYNALKKLAHDLIYKKGWSPQEMEFTFESPSAKDLYLLQTRDMAIRERKKVLTFKAILEEECLGHGIGIGGGAMSGRAVFSLEEISYWRAAEPGTSLILIRADTVPDDIREIYAADGLVTARGGLTSHAAVVAHKLGKTCVVGCGNLVCDEKERTGSFGDVVIRSGDHISIDGREGSVYQGLMEVGSEKWEVRSGKWEVRSGKWEVGS